eukprot:CAMPEP_0168328554 /NCGR_PEP_ID=MMETSP0213-20121227/6579_1 /TAXON_ID=151035 /ORGANISM="Euplotes harpa, Strain FSP1.4" /LENGTH=53 /DNA_ID=CAMNT_0008331705 /DNA_START=123 /DNA_END=284 /DNA_ORIENTATION=+
MYFNLSPGIKDKRNEAWKKPEKNIIKPKVCASSDFSVEKPDSRNAKNGITTRK